MGKYWMDKPMDYASCLAVFSDCSEGSMPVTRKPIAANSSARNAAATAYIQRPRAAIVEFKHLIEEPSVAPAGLTDDLSECRHWFSSTRCRTEHCQSACRPHPK